MESLRLWGFKKNPLGDSHNRDYCILRHVIKNGPFIYGVIHAASDYFGLLTAIHYPLGPMDIWGLLTILWGLL